jgi:CubicO group peptidase (beta-lactamase class C family)
VAVVLALSTVNRIEEIVTRAQTAGRAPAVIAGVVRDGMLVHVTGSGEHPAADRDMQFRIGSITKSFTAALVLGLRDEGLRDGSRLDLDDPVGGHLTELAGSVLGQVPLRRLLAHIGGVQREPDGPWWERNPGGDLDQLLAGLSDDKLTRRPYGEYHYSNLAFGLLGGVVERRTGQPWAQALRSRLLDPLGLRRTTYDPQPPYARGFVVHPWHATLREEPRHDAGAMAPAGQLWSTVEDLATWAAVLASAPPGGPLTPQPSALRPASAAEMATPAVIADPQWTFGYGLGLCLWRRGDRVFCGHTGSMPGYLAVLCIHRPTRTAAVGFANTYSLAENIGSLGLSIVEAVLDNEPPSPPPPWRPAAAAPEAVSALCGRWWWMGRELELAWDGGAGQLIVRAPRGDERDESRFTLIGEDRWLGISGDDAGEILTVIRDSADAVVALDLSTYVLTRDPG